MSLNCGVERLVVVPRVEAEELADEGQVMAKPLWEWVGTYGGPLIVLPSEIAPHWRGIEPSPDAEVSPGWQRGDPGGPVCDCDRARGVEGYVEVLAGDPEPAITAFVPLPDGGIFVRRGHADSVEEVRRAIRAAPEDLRRPEGPEFRVGQGPLLFFESA